MRLSMICSSIIPIPGPTEPRTERTAPGAVSGPSARGSHRLSAAMICPRLWGFRYKRGVVPRRQKSYLILGSFLHTQLAYYFAWLSAHRGETPPTWYADDKDTVLEADAEGQPELLDRAKRVFEDWKLAMTPWAGYPIAVEEEFRAPLKCLLPACPDDVADEIVTCKVDLLDVRGGTTWVTDHKSSEGDHKTGRLAKWKDNGGFDLELQVHQNLHILRAQSDARLQQYPIRGFAIHRLKRAPPFEADLHSIEVPGPAYEESIFTMIEAVRRERQIEANLAAGRKPAPNIGYHCQRCDYVQVCSARSRGDRQGILDEQFVQLPPRTAMSSKKVQPQ